MDRSTRGCIPRGLWRSNAGAGHRPQQFHGRRGNLRQQSLLHSEEQGIRFDVRCGARDSHRQNHAADFRQLCRADRACVSAGVDHGQAGVRRRVGGLVTQESAEDIYGCEFCPDRRSRQGSTPDRRPVFAESKNPGEEFTDLTAQSAEMLQKSLDLLRCSMSLRCHLLEMRIETALMHGSPYSSITATDQRYSFPVAQPLEREVDLSERAEFSQSDEEDGGIPSPRERQVIKLLAEGKANKEMAAVLKLSTRTVEMYRARLMAKLKLHSVAELVRYAVRHKLIEA